jgi:hypothetical protein
MRNDGPFCYVTSEVRCQVCVKDIRTTQQPSMSSNSKQYMEVSRALSGTGVRVGGSLSAALSSTGCSPGRNKDRKKSSDKLGIPGRYTRSLRSSERTLKDCCSCMARVCSRGKVLFAIKSLAFPGQGYKGGLAGGPTWGVKRIYDLMLKLLCHEGLHHVTGACAFRTTYRSMCG